MAELVHQTWSRVTGKPWSAAAAGGFTNGTAQANLALQSRLNSGWNPYAPAAPAPAPAPAPAAAAPAPNSYDQAAATFAAQGATKDAELRTQEEALLAKRAGVTSSYETPLALMNRLSQENKIPELQAQLEPVRLEGLRTEDLLSKLKGDITSRVSNAGGSMADIRLTEGYKREPLVQQLSDLARAQERFAGQLANAQQSVVSQGQLYGEDYKRRVEELNVEMEVFGQRAARESANWSATRQAQYEATISKIKRAEELDNIEAKRVYDDIVAERDYNRDLAKISAGKSGSGADKSKFTEEQQNMIDNLDTVIAGAYSGDKVDPKVAQNRVYNYVKGIIPTATRIGLDPEYLWAQWRDLADGIEGIKTR
jgi:hypothetical protein